MFFSPSVPSALAGLKELPPRLVIAKWGKNESVNGDFVVNHTTTKYLPALQKLLGFEEITVDFEHNTVPGTPAYKADKEPRNVAANNARLRVVEGEGIVAEGLKWTPAGEKSVKEGLHPDLSPTIKTNDVGEVVFVHSAALCRQGAVTDLRVHSAAEIFDAEKLSLFSAAMANPVQSSPSTATTMDYKKLLTILLGLAPNASDADIEAACKTYNESVTALKTHGVTLKALQDSVGALAKRLEDGDRARLIADAIKVGKLVPHGAAIDALPLDSFKAVLDQLPAGVVPLDQRTPEALKTHAASFNSGGNAAEAEVARQMGNDPEKLKKYGDKTR